MININQLMCAPLLAAASRRATIDISGAASGSVKELVLEGRVEEQDSKKKHADFFCQGHQCFGHLALCLSSYST